MRYTSKLAGSRFDWFGILHVAVAGVLGACVGAGAASIAVGSMEHYLERLELEITRQPRAEDLTSVALDNLRRYGALQFRGDVHTHHAGDYWFTCGQFVTAGGLVRDFEVQ